jgi:mannosyltransferase OCH1-like enzyme
VYQDIDAHFVWPLERVLDPDWTELFIVDRTGELTNWFLAATPNSPALSALHDEILGSVAAAVHDDIYAMTGPGALRRAVSRDKVRYEDYRVVSQQGNFTNEFLQYVDHPSGKWHRAQRKGQIIE